MSTAITVTTLVTASREQACESLRLVQVDPDRAVRLARAALPSARAARDAGSEAIAERALGLAGVYLGDLDAAIGHLRASVARGRKAGSAQLVAQARMSLAFAMSRGGEPRRALREIDAALVDLGGVDRARAHAQRAAICQQLGNPDGARAGYRLALIGLRRAGDGEWIQRVLSNRALVHAFQGAYGAAETDLREAGRLCGELDLGLAAAFVEENLAFVRARQGDVTAALRHSHEAETRYRALGAPIASLLIDRAELLLSVCLVTEAREAADHAVAQAIRDNQRIVLPEARLLLARAAALDGDPGGALEELRRAIREFARQDRRAWVALARLQRLSVELEHRGRPRGLLRQAARIADVLDEEDWPDAALDARLLAGRAALQRRRVDEGREHLLRAGGRRRRGPAAIRARAWYAEALLRLADADRRGAVSAVASGLRVLDDHRATPGATDLRAHLSGPRTELTDLALRVALEDGRPAAVLHWAERARAGHLLRPVRPEADVTLSRLLAQLRSTTAELDLRRGHGRDPGSLATRQVVLERSIRDHCRRLPGAVVARVEPPPTPRELRRLLGDAALVEFVQFGGILYVLTVTQARTRLRRLCPVTRVRYLVEFSCFALRRLARAQGSAERRAGIAFSLRRAAEELDELLLRPIAPTLRDRPLVLVPTGCQQSLPWSLLPSCAGRPVTVAPSATLWRTARAASPSAGQVIVAAGPGLPGAREEATAVAAVYGARARTLLGAAATVQAVGSALVSAAVAHLAAHGHLRVDNPLFSSLQLDDGPLTGYDLERLAAMPHTVVLAACDSARSIVRAGDELLGLGASFLSRGTVQLVGSVVPVPDAETVPLMTDFHRRLFRGMVPADALAQAQSELSGADSTEMAAAAGFVCVGAGFSLPRLHNGTSLPDPPDGSGRTSRHNGTGPETPWATTGNGSTHEESLVTGRRGRQ